MKADFLVERTFPTVAPHAGVSSIEKQLLRDGFSVVQDRDTFVGILTPADLVRSPRQLVADCLEDRPPARADDELESVLDLMTRSMAAVLPVFHNGTFLGIIRRSRIADYVTEYHRDLERQITQRTKELHDRNTELQEEIAARSHSERQLERALSEKDILLQEIHHRVKNNLQVVSSLVRLQSEHLGDTRLAEAFRETESRIASMRIVHELLYQNKSLSEIAVEEYLGKMTHGLFHTYGMVESKVQLDMVVDCAPMNIDTAMPCGLLVNELVSNALKHAFPNREGRIEIRLSGGRAEQYILLVADDGIGFAQNFDVGVSPSLGLQLVDALVRQLKGTMERHASEGTVYRICFDHVDKEERRWGKRKYS